MLDSNEDWADANALAERFGASYQDGALSGPTARPKGWHPLVKGLDRLELIRGNGVPFTINLHAGWAWRIEFHNMLKAYGGDWLNEDSTPKFNSPEGVKAVEKILEVVEACMGPDGLTLSIDDVEIGLETGTQASANTWASRAANMDNPEKSQLVGKIGFAPAPRAVAGGPHAGPAAADFYVIPAKTDVDPDLIFRVIMEAADLESQLEAAKLGLVTRSTIATTSRTEWPRPVPRSTCASHPLCSHTLATPRPGRTSMRLTSSQLRTPRAGSATRLPSSVSREIRGVVLDPLCSAGCTQLQCFFICSSNPLPMRTSAGNAMTMLTQ